MRYLLTAAAVCLAALVCQHPARGQKKEMKQDQPAPKWAKVTLGGEIRDLLELRAKYNLYVLLDREIAMVPRSAQWQGPPPKAVHYPVRSMQVGEASWVVTLLDESSEDLKAMLPKLRADQERAFVVMEGRIAAAPSETEPFVTYANATGKMRVVGKASLGMGEIRVEGQAVPGTFPIAKGKVATLAIENGNSPIMVIAGMNVNVTPIKGRARVEGKLIVQKQGPLVVEAQKITIQEPAPKLVPKKKKAK